MARCVAGLGLEGLRLTHSQWWQGLRACTRADGRPFMSVCAVYARHPPTAVLFPIDARTGATEPRRRGTWRLHLDIGRLRRDVDGANERRLAELAFYCLLQ
jgi:hypothetical protein